MENYRKFLIECIEKVVSQHPEWGRMRIAREVYNTGKPMYKNKESKMVQYTERTIGDTYFQITDQPENNKTSFEESETDAVFEYNGTQSITSLSDALKFCKVDQQVWEVERHVFNSWDITMKDAKGAPIKRTNYQCKVWFKKHKLSFFAIDKQKEDMKLYSPKYPKINCTKGKGGKMLEISIYDLHYGKLAHIAETGANYDSKIASQRFMDALKNLSGKSSLYNVEKIVFVIGNDFFNADGISNNTTAGTPQDNDGRWQKMFKGGRELLVTGIEYLMQIAPVEVISIFGNHARQAEFYVGDALECWFHNSKNVTIDNRPRSRKYIQYGNGLLGLCHGDTEKTNQLPMLMATEAPQAWSETRFREFHCGHYHHQRKRVFDTIVEDKSVVVRHLSSLSSADAWHDRAGYVGSKQSAEAFVWDKQNGIESIYYHNIK